MKLLRGLVTLSVGAGVTAWLLASGGTPPELPVRPSAAPTDLDAARADEVAAHAARLRSRLAAMPARPSATRNPFRFGGGAAAPVAHRAGAGIADAPLGTVEAAPAAPARPALHLIGMAEDTVEGVTERTAVLSGLDQVYLVKEGEQIAMRFLVKRIGADAIEIEDLSDSTPILLALR